MRKRLARLVLPALGLALFPVCLAKEAGPSLNSLSWMAGCWERPGQTTSSEEVWMAPAGGTMLGVSRTVTNGKVIETEFMEIREEGTRLVFTALPSGQEKASFPSVEVTESRVIFANPAHDFPQRIAYEKSGDGALLAWIEGTRNGKSRRVEFPMKRAECPGAKKQP